MNMEPDSKIYVAGHKGLVGSALVRRLESQGYNNLITRTHTELDLINQQSVNTFFSEASPEYVFLAAARVGGINANNTYPAEFLYQNLEIQNNVIHASYINGVKKLLFLGSSCIYPKHTTQPMKEDSLLTGPLEPTNEPYAIAKIAGIKMCAAYNRQYGTNFVSVMPTNLYGPNDNYDLENSHVIPTLIRKAHEAKINATEFVVWGSGQPRREFLYSDDMANACVFLMQSVNAREAGELINIGSGQDISIRALAELISEVVGFEGVVSFDTSRPDGTPQKLLDVSKLTKLGWQPKTSFRAGLQKANKDYLDKHYNN